MQGVTLTATKHGNPGETRALPAGIVVELQPATNLPADSRVKYWASPIAGQPWPQETVVWADSVGVGLHELDVQVLKREIPA